VTQPNSAPTYIIGHRNPDTDAICSAIGQAEFLRVNGYANPVAARCGEIPQRTQWVLDEAGVEAPLLLNSVRMTAGQICRRQTIACSPTETFLSAYKKMSEAGARSVPVVDETGNVHGILKDLDLLTLLLPTTGEAIKARQVQANLQKITETLEGQIFGTPLDHSQEEETLRLLISASSEQVVKSRLQQAAENNKVSSFIVISGDLPETHRLAIEFGVRALIITGGFHIDPELDALAKVRGVPVICCQKDTASTTQLIRCSRILKNALGETFHTIHQDERVSDLPKKLDGLKQDLFPVLNRDEKIIGVLSRADLIDPQRPRIILVDHNEYSQAVDGIEEAELVEVIDHHRLGGDLTSKKPISFLNEPVGSTSTLIARKFRHRDLIPSKGTATCLIAGIVSDTLHLTSPTTTDVDREILAWLATITGIDTQAFTQAFFNAGSLLANASAEEILTTDRKEFRENGIKVSISQIEEIGLEKFSSRRGELQVALENLHQSHKNDLSFLVVTDIAEHYSLILVIGDNAYLDEFAFLK